MTSVLEGFFGGVKYFVLDRELLREEQARRNPVHRSFERRLAEIKRNGGEFSLLRDENGKPYEIVPKEQIELFIRSQVRQNPNENSLGDPAVWESFRLLFDRGCVVPQDNPIPTRVKGVTMEVYAEPLDVRFRSTGNSSAGIVFCSPFSKFFNRT